MPTAYFGSQISENMTETPDGNLICRNVPLARTGYYEYAGRDLIGLDSAEPDKMYRVLRRPEEVFSLAAIASFEGKAFTDDHPPVPLITPDNFAYYAKGHVENVHKGTGKDAGCLVGDIFAADRDIIQAIKDGKREISCGYGCKWVPQKNGVIDQQAICGNHVALVDNGRAGSHIAIKDSKSKPAERGKTMSVEKKGNILGRMFKAFASDEGTTPEDIEEAMEVVPKGKVTDAEPVKPTTLEVKPEIHDEAPNPIMECLAKIMDRLEKLEAATAPKAEDDKDELEQLIGEKSHDEGDETPTEGIQEEEYDPIEGENSVTVSPENVPESQTAADSMSAMKAEAKRTRSLLAKVYKDKPAEFKAAAHDAVSAIRAAYGIGVPDNSGYANFAKLTAKASKQNAHDSAATAPEQRYAESQNAYDAMNPHKKAKMNGGK
jgi:hypothetical protein